MVLKIINKMSYIGSEIDVDIDMLFSGFELQNICNIFEQCGVIYFCGLDFNDQ